MSFDLFLSITSTPVDGKCPSEREMWENAFDQIRIADELGFGVAWFAESHLSHRAQLQNSTPTCPTFEGEIGLNSDFPQLAARVLSVTKQIGVGSAALNIFSNGGPVANAERIAQLVSMHHALSDFPNREIHVAFSAGRFEHARSGFGILPRNEFEAIVWEELQPLILQEAIEVFLRLLRGDILRSDHLIPCVLSSNQVADQSKWFMLIRMLKQHEQMKALEKESNYVKTIREKLAWCMNVRRIDDHRVQFPFRFVYPEQHIAVISKPLDASCLRLFLASHDSFAQRLANKWLPVQVANLSVTAPEAIEQTHELMKQAYHPSGGKWKREYMPRTVLVFLNADSNFTDVEQNQAAHSTAIIALKAYWKAVEGTIVDENSPVFNLRNAVWGCPAQVASQLRNRYHPQDRLMLWFDFFNHDSVAVCRSMRIFMEIVVPLTQDGRALHLLQPQWAVTNDLNDLQQKDGDYQSISNGCSNTTVTDRREIVLVIDLLPSIQDVDEAQWTSEWIKNSSPGIETQIIKGIDDYWPSESELTGCLGVVITGSTCSCMNDYPHTEPLFAFFKTVIRLQVPVLAICYSAQMLVRWLAGKENVIRLSRPHVGFVRVEFLADRGAGRRFSLLNDVEEESLISSTAQFDGFILPDELKRFSVQVGSAVQETRFIHVASATEWKYQAFKLLGLPVWGVQFHLNWPADGAEAVFRILKSQNPNIVVEKQGIVDENERRSMARGFLCSCRHYVMLKWVISIQMSGLTNLSTPSYVSQNKEAAASSEKQFQDIHAHYQCNEFTCPGTISFSGSAMQMSYRVTVVPRTPHSVNLKNELDTAIKVVFDKVHMVLNNWNSESEISKAVKSFQNGAESVILSPLLARIFRVAFEVHEVTDKSFDPTVGGIKKLWKSPERLSSTYMEAASSAVGFSRLYSLRMSDNNNLVELHRAKYETDHVKAYIDLDLCSIAKGFAVDLICDALQNMEIEGYCVEWAGEIRIHGLDPFRNPWKTTIVRAFLSDRPFDHSEEPFHMSYDSLVNVPDVATMSDDSLELTSTNVEKYRLESSPSDFQLQSLQLNKESYFQVDLAPQYTSQDIALATSGALYETLGDNLSHVINPSTQQPVHIAADSPVCVTVILGSAKAPVGDAPVDSHVGNICAWADALATSAMVESSVFDCVQFLWNIANRSNNSPLPSQYSLLNFYTTSKDGRTFGKSSVADRLSLQTRWLLASLPLPVCVLVTSIPYAVNLPYPTVSEPEKLQSVEAMCAAPLTLACVCTSAFASMEGSFFVSLSTQSRVCRLLANENECSVTELTAYFLFPAQKDLVRAIIARPDSAMLDPDTHQKLEKGASRIVRVQLIAHHTVGDHIVFLGSCRKQEFREGRILCYAKKRYFESETKTISGSLPQPSCTLAHSRVSLTGPRNLKNSVMPIATGVCSSKPPVMYAVTSIEDILVGDCLSLNFGFSLENEPAAVSAATSTAVTIETPSAQVSGVVSSIIPLAEPDSMLVMMDVIGVSTIATH